ncbi:pilin [Pseudoxanthomonas beigongshangi]|uniref:pilin n=1 Tax=Pseudoxanthomonas beigongshangi TaxID=2782537 RepID=UPI00193B13FE|nr:prepilin-type N-terminal cleavage/methylation domain-containing protein [Pseudoxanthomonas beigongshangi]
MNARAQGFTLVELMIALAVISLLLALALPAYRDYRIRAAFSEGLNAASQIKLAVNEYVFTEGNPRDRLQGIGWRPGAIGHTPWRTSEQLGYRPYMTFSGKPGSYNFWVDASARGEIFVRMMGDSIARCRPALGGPLTVVLVPTLDANATTLSWTCRVYQGDGSTDPACVPANCQTPYKRS